MPQNSDKIQHIDASTPMRRIMSASSLSSDSVRNQMGEDIGSIKEIMIDVPSGQVAYAVLSFGGFLGIGQKLFAIPWGALTLDEDRKCFMLDVDKRTLEEALGFDKDHWPDMAEPTWGRDVHHYYGREPYWEQSPGDSYSMTGANREGAKEEAGRAAVHEYNRGARAFAGAYAESSQVESKAREAERALERPEGESLRKAEQIGKQHSKVDDHER
jgi:sporulation protein YlmC with PRC-barrel domain